MDIFKQKKYLTIVIAILIIMNLGMLFMMWVSKPPLQQPRDPRGRMPHEREQINTMLKRELGFNEGQIGKYLILRQLHREQISNLDNEIRDLKRQMFDEVLQNNSPPTLSDSLLSITLEKQGQIELLTYQHLLDLKKLCGPEQQDKLQMLLHELFRSKSAGEGPNPPPPHLGEEQRQKHQGGFLPPPPPGERPQIHPPRNQ